MKRLAPLWLLGLAFAVASCDPNDIPTDPGQTGDIPADGKRPRGQSYFETPTNGGGASRGAYGPEANADAAGAAPASASPAQAPRLIEESDIYKVDGTNLFILNRYRGLQILDISDLDNPKLLGKAPIYGYPKDMYVRNGNAYVIVSDYWSYWRSVDSADSVVPFWGSQLRIVDVRDVRNPTVVGSINLEGDCGDSRIVGHVMYLVSHRFPWWGYGGSTDTEDKTSVVSIDIADPQNIRVVATEDFPRNGWDHHVYVNTQAIFLSASQWLNSYDQNGNWVNDYRTTIRYIDISDPNGAIKVRGSVDMGGLVRDRWGMDVYDNVLRVASGQGWGNGTVYLTTFDVANPDAIARLGQAALYVNEQLTAARFDGNRGYLVSARRIDPLFTFDLSDPANPKLLGELVMTGWLDFMVPMGNRVVALGHDTTADSSGNNQVHLAVSLIDVGSNQPVLLDRVPIDGAWGWVPSEADDFAKVFRVLPDVNLVLFPYSAWDTKNWTYVGGVQLIDFFADHLTKRGVIGNAGWVERGVPYGTNTVLTISSEIFQTIDIADRDQPRVRARLELARNVTDFAVLGDTHTAQLGGDWYRGDTNLTITPIDDPDAVAPTASVHVPAPYGRMFTNGNMAYITSVVQQNDPVTGTYSATTHVQVVDLSDPAAPVVRGTLDLPEAVWGSYGYWYWGYGDEVVQVNGSVLAFHHYAYNYWYGDCFDCGRPYGGGTVDNAHRIYLVDLSIPDAPRLASTVTLTDLQWAWGLRAQGSTLLLSEYDYVQRGTLWYSRYHLRPIDLANLDNPVVGAPISIPGWLIGTSEVGPYIYTLENWWDSTGQTSHTVIHALELFEGRAYLQSSVETQGYLYNIEVTGNAAFAVTQNYWTEVLADGTTQYFNKSELIAFDLNDPGEIRLAGRADVPDNWGWLRRVAGGRAFVTGNAGIFSFNVTDVNHPVFEDFFRTYGWAQDVVVHGQKAFLPSGYYGVQVLNLGP